MSDSPTFPFGMVEPNLAAYLRRRENELDAWLAQNAADIERAQLHLRPGTAERAYWHYGYLAALRDIQRLVG